MFLRLLIEGGQLEREQGLACLELIDAGSPPPNAAQVAMQVGSIDEAQARSTHEQVMAHFASSGEQVAEISQEEAVRGVSSETAPLPAEPRYFDLTHTTEGLEGYHLGPQIGQTTCYSCYRGRGPGGERVRILTLSSRFEGYPDLVAEVTAELQAWLGFQHESGSGPVRLGRTLARGDRPAQTVVVYPYHRGDPVSEYLREQGAVAGDLALDVVIDVCEVLAAAHPKGLALGGLRADGVAFDGERASVIDLGLSKAHSVAGGFASAGVPFGDSGYLAPEVIQERQTQPTPASDVYALGILYYELICGVQPYRGTPLEQLERHFASPLPPPPPEVDFSTTTAGVILRMTAKTTQERAQDAVSLAEALKEFRAGRAFRIQVGPAAVVPIGAEPVSQDAWEDTAAKAAEGGAPDWTESMIDATPGVGPSELQPLASGSLDMMNLAALIPSATGPVSQRLPREMLASLRAESEQADESDDIAEEPSDDPAPLASRREDKIQIGEKLGRGAIGASYDGRIPGHTGPLVLKAISRKFTKHVDILSQVREDIQRAVQVRGERVVSVLELVEADERHLIVSERSSGKTLEAVLKEQPRQSLDLVVGLARDLADALRSGLAVDMSHGDIRPEKVYIEGGRARLADFGHARGACLGAGLGKYGLYFGHPHYLAPEVLQKGLQVPSLATDLYAVGVVLYQTLCGVLPFTGKGIRKTLLAQIKQPLPPPPQDLSVPSALAELIIRLTTKDPSGRFGTLEELDQALDTCLEASMASADALRVGGSGIASAFQVEEFDPLASSMGDEAREAWGTRSQESAKPPPAWSRAKIQAGDGSAPNWAGAKASVTAGELYADLEKASATKGKGGKSKKKKKGGKADSGEGSNTPFWVGGVVLALIGIGVGVASMSSEDPKPRRTPTPRRGSSVAVGPAGTSPSPAAADTARDAALSAYRGELDSMISSGRYAQAEALALPDSLAKDAGAVALRGKLVGRARDAAKKKLAKVKPRFRAFLDKGRLGEAGTLLEEVRGWAPATMIEGWVDEVRKRLKAEEGVLAGVRQRLKLKGGELDPSRILSRIRHKSSRAYASGGVVAQYSRGREVVDDLMHLRRKGVVELGDAPSGARGISLTGSRRKPGVLAWRPELLACQRIKIRIETRAATGALLLGVDARGQDGVGISFGGVKAELGRRRLDRDGKSAPLDGPFELEIRLSGAGRPRLECRSNSTNRGFEVAADRLTGRVGLCVDSGEAWIVRLEIWGIAR